MSEINAAGLAAAEQLWRDYDRRGGYAPSVRMLIERYVERSSSSADNNGRCRTCGEWVSPDGCERCARNHEEVEAALDFVRRDIRNREASYRFREYTAGMRRAVEMLEQRLVAVRSSGSAAQNHEEADAHEIEMRAAHGMSPQGEDHEAATDALDSIEGYAQRLSDSKGWGATRRCIVEEAQKVRAYLSLAPSPVSGTEPEQ